MSSYYPYLIASLPMLHFEAHLPFSFERFLEMCYRLIPDEDLRALENISIERADDKTPIKQETIRQWNAFEVVLRNELAKIRAHRKKIDASKYVRQDGYADTFVTHIASGAARNPSPQDAERMLDRERWNYLEKLAMGHYFDLDYLVTYAYKLLLLQRWQKIRTANRPALLEDALSAN